ncbi:MAG: iron-sulfur cluster insertion protein ErpA [Armatimonadota bacterium]|nr:iron-sulfur cluster insertion protein ErpA [Armatimonadota bacterium]MDR7519639.1 iron-sulfur cluster insertion protein ErpA [Armatimonadota bacterium]MDR7549796.1 iron-sulfur cluster insertion protein ErpA [Armatimonadota bacterium]
MITITPQAAAKLSEILKQQDDPAARLRLFIAKGGCHGYTYGMVFDAERREGDQVLAQHGVELVVDPVSLRLLAGAQIDYVTSVTGEGFAVRNPNAVETCGCGHSFQTAEGDGEPDPCEDATAN